MACKIISKGDALRDCLNKNSICVSWPLQVPWLKGREFCIPLLSSASVSLPPCVCNTEKVKRSEKTVRIYITLLGRNTLGA